MHCVECGQEITSAYVPGEGHDGQFGEVKCFGCGESSFVEFLPTQDGRVLTREEFVAFLATLGWRLDENNQIIALREGDV